MTFPTSLRASTFALLAASLSVVAPALAQQDSPASRWDSFKEDTGGLFGSLFGGSERTRGEERPTSGAHPTVIAQMSATDLMVRLDRLENQIRQLTGAVEQLQFRNQQIEQQLRRSQEDAEFRFQELGRGGPARPRVQPPAPSAAPSGPPGAGVPGRRSDVFDPNDNPNAPGAPQAIGALPPGRPSAPLAASAPPAAVPPPIAEEEPPPIGAPGGRQAGSPLDLSTLSDQTASDPDVVPGGAPPRIAAAPGAEPRNIPGPLPPPPPRNPNATGGQQVVMAPSATPKDEFALAQGYVQRKDYALAEDSFRAFLKKYPGDRLASDAHYWLGESMFQRQRYRDAAESFLTVSTKFDQSGKAPEALLRLGQSLAALGEREAACATLGEVLRKYPRAAPGVKQGVAQEQKRARC